MASAVILRQIASSSSSLSSAGELPRHRSGEDRAWFARKEGLADACFREAGMGRPNRANHSGPIDAQLLETQWQSRGETPGPQGLGRAPRSLRVFSLPRAFRPRRGGFEVQMAVDVD